MKNYIYPILNSLKNKKRIYLILAAFIIGIAIYGSRTLSHTKNSQPSFKSIEDTLEKIGDVAGDIDIAPPSVTVTPTRFVGTKATPTATPPPQQITTIRTTTQSGGSGTSTSATAPKTPTPTNKPAASTVTATPAPTLPPQPTQTPTVAATHTPAPTPTSAVTPTPGFSGSLGTSVNEDTLTVTASANRELAVCIFHFYNSQGFIIDTKDAPGSGNSCQVNRGSDPALSKIKATLAAKNTSDQQIEVEKNAPFE